MVDENEISEGTQRWRKRTLELGSDVESLKQQLCMAELGKLIILICPPLKKFIETNIFFIAELENAKQNMTNKRRKTKATGHIRRR